jgi:hypothetical protein
LALRRHLSAQLLSLLGDQAFRLLSLVIDLSLILVVWFNNYRRSAVVVVVVCTARGGRMSEHQQESGKKTRGAARHPTPSTQRNAKSTPHKQSARTHTKSTYQSPQVQ